MSKSDTILSAKSLRYFLQLIETMNYTQAAQILGITQPALTQQVKKIGTRYWCSIIWTNGEEVIPNRSW